MPFLGRCRPLQEAAPVHKALQVPGRPLVLLFAGGQMPGQVHTRATFLTGLQQYPVSRIARALKADLVPSMLVHPFEFSYGFCDLDQVLAEHEQIFRLQMWPVNNISGGLFDTRKVICFSSLSCNIGNPVPNSRHQAGIRKACQFSVRLNLSEQEIVRALAKWKAPQVLQFTKSTVN